MQHLPLELFIGIASFVTLSVAGYYCLPLIDRFIKLLEDKGHKDAQEAAHR